MAKSGSFVSSHVGTIRPTLGINRPTCADTTFFCIMSAAEREYI
jgi:hypothetical protein